MQRGRENFRCRSRAAIDQYHQPRAVGDVARLGFDAKFGIRSPSLGTDDGAVIEKIIGDLHRRIEHAAGIVAQVDDEAFEFPGARVLEFGYRALQFGWRCYR